MEIAMYLATVNLFPTWFMKKWELESNQDWRGGGNYWTATASYCMNRSKRSRLREVMVPPA